MTASTWRVRALPNIDGKLTILVTDGAPTVLSALADDHELGQVSTPVGLVHVVSLAIARADLTSGELRYAAIEIRNVLAEAIHAADVRRERA